MKKINIALLGAGFMGKTHTYALKNLPFYYDGLEYEPCLHTVYARREEAAAAFAQRYGFENYTTDLDKVMNDPEIDVVDICTPNDCHFETLQKAIRAGKHILCEKPVVTNMLQADKIKELLDAHPNIIHRVVFNNRHLPATMRAAELFSQGKIGRLITFRSIYLHSSAMDPEKKAGWKQTAQRGGGSLFDLGSHALDLFLFITQSDAGCAPKSLVGCSQIAFPTRLGMDGETWNTDADEAFYLLCRLKNGATGSFEASKIAQGTNDALEIELRGTDGAMKFDLMNPNTLYFFDANNPDLPLGGTRGYTAIECMGRYPQPEAKFHAQKSPVEWIRGHVHNMYTFLNDVSRGTNSGPSLYHGLYINRILDTALRSDKSGTWEEIDD